MPDPFSPIAFPQHFKDPSMKYAIAVLCALTMAGCTSVSTVKFSGTPGCQNKSLAVNGQPVSTDFCMRKLMFKPSQYLVQVNGQAVFEGTDYTRVAFEKQIREGRITGGCDARVQIQDTKTERPVAFATLPDELTTGCHISADSNGGSLPFKKDETCDKVFYTHLAPILGKVIPIELSRQCVVRLNSEVIFDGTFRF
jgi:hypothetical protein